MKVTRREAPLVPRLGEVFGAPVRVKPIDRGAMRPPDWRLTSVRRLARGTSFSRDWRLTSVRRLARGTSFRT